MKSKYQLEIDCFRERFAEYQDKNIAIYGIGRRTATLLPGISDFNIVGLLDYDEKNLGKKIGGVSVISLREAEKKSDMIIINSDPTNYQIIYRRILGVTVPVYYANGNKAELLEIGDFSNSYWDSNLDKLKNAIEIHDVVSFDFFDTLCMRKLLSPSDVFRILDKKAKALLLIPCNLDYSYIRQNSMCNENGKELVFEEIYNEIAKKIDLSEEIKLNLMKLELEVEKQVCCPRRTIVQMVNYALSIGKETYIISDTYFNKDQIKIFLEYCGVVDFPQSNIILSSEEKKYKCDGSLWKIFSKLHENRKKLHIGDNQVADIQMAQKYGIDTFYVMSGKQMLESSNLSRLLSEQKRLSDFVHIGLVISRIFNDPFALSKTHGKLSIKSAKTFGYVLFGGVLCRFLMWLHGNVLKNKIDRVLFFARDGYFLIRDYQYLVEQLKVKAPNMKYLEISRRLLYMITMETEDDMWKAAVFPYMGNFDSYLKSRFNIETSLSSDDVEQENVDGLNNIEKLKEKLLPYKDAIWEEAKREKENYTKYLDEEGIVDSKTKDAVVDLGFYGTNQFYYQKLLNKQVEGYYFSACYSKENEYIKTCNIKGCFNSDEDPNAERSYIKQKNAFLESFLTAPYGMLRYFDDEGKMVCESKKTNQINFFIKEECNSGVQEYMKDYIDICGLQDNPGYMTSEAFTYYTILTSNTELDSSVRKGFYFDNDMAGTQEMELDI